MTCLAADIKGKNDARPLHFFMQVSFSLSLTSDASSLTRNATSQTRNESSLTWNKKKQPNETICSVSNNTKSNSYNLKSFFN